MLLNRHGCCHRDRSSIHTTSFTGERLCTSTRQLVFRIPLTQNTCPFPSILYSCHPFPSLPLLLSWSPFCFSISLTILCSLYSLLVSHSRCLLLSIFINHNTFLWITRLREKCPIVPFMQDGGRETKWGQAKQIQGKVAQFSQTLGTVTFNQFQPRGSANLPGAASSMVTLPFYESAHHCLALPLGEQRAASRKETRPFCFKSCLIKYICIKQQSQSETAATIDLLTPSLGPPPIQQAPFVGGQAS